MKKLLGILALGLLLTQFQYQTIKADHDSIVIRMGGSCEGNCSNGRGTYAYAKGDIYVGEFKDGKRHGGGTYAYNNGDQYVGAYKDDELHGQGTYVYAGGDQYVGAYKYGKRHGQGTFTWVDGKVDKGIWEYNELQKNNIFIKIISLFG